MIKQCLNIIQFTVFIQSYTYIYTVNIVELTATPSDTIGTNMVANEFKGAYAVGTVTKNCPACCYFSSIIQSQF